MKITFAKVNEIYKTLPIGYYIGREVKSKMSESEGCSYYDMLADEITFSYPQVARALNKLPEGASDDIVERFVRTMLYHELSHAMLTPKDLKCTKYSNIVEDERIETLLTGYYRNTNFRELVKACNDDMTCNCFDDFFFDVVRFRKGPQVLLDALDDLISKYGLNVNAATEDPYYYSSAIYSFVELCKNYYNDPSNQVNQQSSQGTPQISQNGQQTMPNNSTNSDQKDEEENENSENQNETSGGSSEDNSENEDFDEDFDDSEDFEDEDENDSDPNEDSESSRAGKFKAIRSALSKVTEVFQNDRIQQELTLIFGRAAKAHKLQGSAVNTYSGRFDPRSAARDDCRYFVQQNRNGNAKGFSKVHLNLFLDRSGSYQNNCLKTNQILAALSKIERTNPQQFSFTIISCGHGQDIEDKKNYVHRAYDGTTITSSIFGTFKQVQEKTATNYNIVLYDGEAWCGYNFAAFNTPNTAIISDTSNRKNINKYAPSTTKIFVEDGQYADTLQENVIKVLQGLIR